LNVIDAPSTWISLTGCVRTELAAFRHAKYEEDSQPPGDKQQNIIEHLSHAKKIPGFGAGPDHGGIHSIGKKFQNDLGIYC